MRRNHIINILPEINSVPYPVWLNHIIPLLNFKEINELIRTNKYLRDLLCAPPQYTLFSKNDFVLRKKLIDEKQIKEFVLNNLNRLHQNNSQQSDSKKDLNLSIVNPKELVRLHNTSTLFARNENDMKANERRRTCNDRVVAFVGIAFSIWGLIIVSCARLAQDNPNDRATTKKIILLCFALLSAIAGSILVSPIVNAGPAAAAEFGVSAICMLIYCWTRRVENRAIEQANLRESLLNNRFDIENAIIERKEDRKSNSNDDQIEPEKPNL